MIENLENSDRSWEYLQGAKKYLFCGVLVFSVLALPESRFQDLFRIVVWTIIVLGTITPYVLPFVGDMVSRAVLASIYIFHFGIIYLFYDRIPHSDYLVIGLFALCEIICLLIPLAWLEVRHSRHNVRPAAAEHEADSEKKKW